MANNCQMTCSFQDNALGADSEMAMISENNSETAISGYDSKFFRSIRLLINCCRINGLFFTKRRGGRNCAPVNKSMIFCASVVAILGINVLRSFSVYKLRENNDNILFFKIQLSIWCFESAVKSVVMFVYCYRDDGFALFFLKWRKCVGDETPDQLTLRCMKAATFVCWMFVVINTMGILLSFFLQADIGELFTSVAVPEVPHEEAGLIMIKILMTFVIFLNSSAAVFPIALLVVLSLAVIKRFNDFVKDFKSRISKEGEFDGDLDSYRLRHQKLCTLVVILDRMFMNVIAAVFVANTVMFCIILYNLIYTPMKVSYRILNIFWLSMMLAHLTVVSVTAAWLHVSAHSPLHHIYKIRANGQLRSRHLEITMFISRLTGSGIGLTSGNMFVIDKPSILTVAGMMITYFIVMLELKQPGSSVDEAITCNCNCSCPLG